MSEVLQNIITRRSIRSFTNRKISDEDLNLILKAASYAPSGMNRQSWKFTAIQNKEIIQSLAKVVRETLGRDENYNFYDPVSLILVSNEKENTNGLADSACALQNIFLMAHSLGIGSCWINQLKTICDEKEVREMLNKLDIPENHIVWGMAALGYAKQPAKEHVIKDNIINIIK